MYDEGGLQHRWGPLYFIIWLTAILSANLQV